MSEPRSPETRDRVSATDWRKSGTGSNPLECVKKALGSKKSLYGIARRGGIGFLLTEAGPVGTVTFWGNSYAFFFAFLMMALLFYPMWAIMIGPTNW